jgi:hypothetical protein
VVVSRSDSILCFVTPEDQGDEARGRAEILTMAGEIQRQLERKTQGVTVSIGLSSFTVLLGKDLSDGDTRFELLLAMKLLPFIS